MVLSLILQSSLAPLKTPSLDLNLLTNLAFISMIMEKILSWQFLVMTKTDIQLRCVFFTKHQGNTFEKRPLNTEKNHTQSYESFNLRAGTDERCL